jgi:ribosome recycling factor
MIDEIMVDTKTRMKKSIGAVKVELAKNRTGRATPALLDHIVVSYYGNDALLHASFGVGHDFIDHRFSPFLTHYP